MKTRKTIRTPSDAEFLLFCHCCCETHPRLHAPAIREAVAKFLECGAIAPHPDNPNRWSTTEKGAAWVQAICNIEEPRVAYVDASGKDLMHRG